MPIVRHTARRRASVWALLVLFLVGTAIPAVSRMECLMSGHSTVSVGYADECCPEEGSGHGAVVKPICCEVLTAKPIKQPFAQQVQVPVPDQPAVVGFQFVDVPAMVLHRPCAHSNPRPPPTALDVRLAAVGFYLI